jgi:hypothetical protein
MAKQENAIRKTTRVLGDVYPGGILTKEGCMRRLGLGRNLLIEARQSGLVTPIRLGNGKRMYYRTSELIAWIESHANSNG